MVDERVLTPNLMYRASVVVALWGATGALTHANAIFGRGLLEKPPLLQHLAPLSAIVRPPLGE